MPLERVHESSEHLGALALRDRAHARLLQLAQRARVDLVELRGGHLRVEPEVARRGHQLAQQRVHVLRTRRRADEGLHGEEPLWREELALRHARLAASCTERDEALDGSSWVERPGLV